MQEGECKGVKTLKVHAAKANQEHISPLSPGIGVIISNIAKNICRDRGEMLRKSRAEKALNIRRMISRFKSDASNASVRGIIVDGCCSHECLSGCGLPLPYGLK